MAPVRRLKETPSSRARKGENEDETNGVFFFFSLDAILYKLRFELVERHTRATGGNHGAQKAQHIDDLQLQASSRRASECIYSCISRS